jgi:hypothetical protein
MMTNANANVTLTLTRTKTKDLLYLNSLLELKESVKMCFQKVL